MKENTKIIEEKLNFKLKVEKLINKRKKDKNGTKMAKSALTKISKKTYQNQYGLQR